MRINPISDPVLRKRLVIANSADPTKTALFLIGLVILLVVIVLHFFPQLLVPLFSSDPNSSEDRKTTANSTISSEAEAANPPLLPTVPADTQPDRSNSSNQEIAPLSSTDKKTSADILPTENISSPNPDIPQNDKKLTTPQIEQLLNRAKEQIAKTRLTTPRGDNAFETYRTLQRLSPKHADELFTLIITWYFEQAQTYLAQKRITTPNRNNAYHIYQKLQEIAPQHSATQTLLENIVEEFKRSWKEKLPNTGVLSGQQITELHTLSQNLVDLAPKHPLTRQLLTDLLERLLRQGEQQLISQKYTTPEGDNALETYQHILKIAPDHAKAQAGLETIRQKYYQLALGQEKRGKYTTSLIMIERGLQISPSDLELQELKQRVEQQLSVREQE